MQKQPIVDGWTVRPVSNLENVPKNAAQPTPAMVPGCVHTDLLRAGKIEDPYHDRNEPTLRWIGQTDWLYETSFDVTDELLNHERVDLRCDGLDTIATIEVNGAKVGTTENQHVAYRFDIKKHLRKGRNTLAIKFASAELYAFAMEKKLGKLPFLNCRVPFNMIRKMACNFGWDWGPEFITCGIWKEIRLEAWSVARIKAVRPNVRTLSERASNVQLTVDLEWADFSTPGLPWFVDARFKNPLNSKESVGEELIQKNTNTARFSISIEEPALWWPDGYGKPNLYKLSVGLREEGTDNDLVWDESILNIGLRTVELDTAPDAIGRPFILKVNGKPVFCKGYNWIPDDCFPDRANDPKRLRTRITQALESNANMLRVWGGGIYETDAFYDLCDELGVLVWQDCLFACAAYPEEEPIKSLVEQEIRHNVTRLAHHPSLVIWNGCNENVWGYYDWGWKRDKLVEGRTWGTGYYFDLIPNLIKELDPSRPYWAASPWSGDTDFENGLHPNLASHGNKHVWEVWSEPYEIFRKFTPRFCSEFGFQAPPNFATLKACMPKDQLVFGSESMKLHQKSPSWDVQVIKRVSDVFGDKADRSFDELHYLLQVNQARALQVGVEWFRSRMPECMGTLYWQLNDCWPVNSWSAIDGDGRLKPLWYATRRFYADRLLTIQPKMDFLELCAVNDSDEPWTGEAVISNHQMTGETRVVKRIKLNVAPRTVGRFQLGESPILRPTEREAEFLVAEIGSERAHWFYEPDFKLKWPRAKWKTSIKTIDGGAELTVEAETVLRDLLIQVDRVDPSATIDENLVTLLPAEKKTFVIRTKKELTLQDLERQAVMWCTNSFVGG